MAVTLVDSERADGTGVARFGRAHNSQAQLRTLERIPAAVIDHAAFFLRALPLDRVVGKRAMRRSRGCRRSAKSARDTASGQREHQARATVAVRDQGEPSSADRLHERGVEGSATRPRNAHTWRKCACMRMRSSRNAVGALRLFRRCTSSTALSSAKIREAVRLIKRGFVGSSTISKFRAVFSADPRCAARAMTRRKDRERVTQQAAVSRRSLLQCACAS